MLKQSISMWDEFPCWSWESTEPLELKSFVQSFQKIVPNQRWVFCRSDVAQTSRQLWTATTVSNRNTERGTAQARTLDAEFLRVLAGTHNVSEAFKRAGLQNESTSGWLLHIPEQATSEIPDSVEQEANQLLNGLGLSKTSEDLQINFDGAKNLGISLDEATDLSRIEASLIGHILLADVSSSQ
ncbi:MAG: hypothetical protein CMB25_05085 [Euryarchaeota archaeon]|nr:hypothetical protein [Euryarchaeota archaeon]